MCDIVLKAVNPSNIQGDGHEDDLFFFVCHRDGGAHRLRRDQLRSGTSGPKQR